MKKKLSILSIITLLIVCFIGCNKAFAATTYRVYYDYQGGKSSTNYSTAYQTKKANVNLTLRKDTPTKNGYVFQGYKVSTSAGNASYQPGDIYKRNANMTLYAMWAPRKYTITYNANGGSYSISSATKTYGRSYTVPTQKPTRTGYTFMGWGLTSTTSTVYVSPGGKITSNSNIRLYAIWKANTYNVTYNYGNGNVVTEKRIYGQTYKVKSPHTTREAEVVSGWSLNNNSTTATIKTGDLITRAGNVTLYPVWVTKTYKITLKYPVTNVINDKIQTTFSSIVISKKHGEKINLDGYYNLNHIRGTGVCIGWATSATATIPTYTTTYAANKNATLYLITSNKFNNQIGGTVYYSPDYLTNDNYYLNDAKYVDSNGETVGNLFYNIAKPYKVVYMPYNRALKYREVLNTTISYLELLFGDDFDNKKHYSKLTIDTLVGFIPGSEGYDIADATINLIQIDSQYDELLKTQNYTASQYNSVSALKYIKSLRVLCGFVPFYGTLNTISGEIDYVMQKTILDSYKSKLSIIDSYLDKGYGLKLTYSASQGLDQDVIISAWKNNYLYVNYALKAGMNNDGSYSHTGTLYANKISYGKYDISGLTYYDYFN